MYVLTPPNKKKMFPRFIWTKQYIIHEKLVKLIFLITRSVLILLIAIDGNCHSWFQYKEITYGIVMALYPHVSAYNLLWEAGKTCGSLAVIV